MVRGHKKLLPAQYGRRCRVSSLLAVLYRPRIRSRPEVLALDNDEIADFSAGRAIGRDYRKPEVMN